MPTWGKMSIFTWGELIYFKWSEVPSDVIRLAHACEDRELILPNSVKEKVQQLCREEFLELSKITGISITPPSSKLSTFADVLGIIGFLQSLLDNPTVADIVQNLLSLLTALLAGQL